MSTLISFADMKHARQTLEDFTLSYFPLHNLQLPKEFLRHWDIFAYVESVLYQVDKENELLLKELFPTSDSSFLDLQGLRDFLQQRSLLSHHMERLLAQGEEYWRLERRICHHLLSEERNVLTQEDVHLCSSSKSFDYRVLHELVFQLYDKTRSPLLLEYLRVDEQLLDIGDDLVDYEEDIVDNAFNIYRCYVHLFGRDAELALVSYISRLEEERARFLNQLSEELQTKIILRQKEAAIEPGSEKWIFPQPIFDEKAYRKRVEEHVDS